MSLLLLVPRFVDPIQVVALFVREQLRPPGAACQMARAR